MSDLRGRRAVCLERGHVNNLKESKVADDLKTKKRILVCCMFELLFHLTLNARIRSEIPLKAFSPFIVAQK